MTDDLVVVGGSVATTAFLERMRELGFSDPITVVDNDPDAPYDRPPVSKRFLAEADYDDIAVDWSDLGATIVRARAVGVDRVAHTVLVQPDSGEPYSVPFSRLVIATGAIPARLPIEPANTFVLRSAEDARRLRAQTDAGQSVVIIGAGVVGVELASSLAARGSQVTLLDRASGPLERLLAGHLMAETTEWLESIGVSCLWEAGIQSVRHDADGWVVELADGQVVNPDLVVSAVGARPAVEWLTSSDLLINGALLVNDEGNVVVRDEVAPHIHAIGDVVTRLHDDGSVERTESWAAARQHAISLAEALSGAQRGQIPAPYFWTEVAGRMVQVIGTLEPGAALEVEWSNPERGSTLYRVAAEGSATAWIGINSQPRIARLMRGEG